MSLINQVLRDLDARKVGGKARVGLPVAVTPLSARTVSKSPGYRWWLAAGLVVAGLVVLAIRPWRTTSPAPPALEARLATPPLVSQPVGDSSGSPKVGAGETASLPVPPLGDVSGRLSAASGNASVAAQRAPAKAHSAPSALHAETTLHFKPDAGSATGGANATTEKPRAKAMAMDSLSTASSPDGESAAKIEKKPHQATVAERAENAYRQGITWQQQGRLEDALEGYRNALDAQADHVAARQALVALLIQLHRADEAEDVLTRGMALPASALPSLLALGRLRVDRDDAPGALQLLLEHADIGARSAEYEGFLATLLNRAGHHDEAVEHYRRATQLAPRDARWWAGLGIALEAQGQSAMAREAYVRARDLPGLPDELAKHVEQRLHQ